MQKKVSVYRKEHFNAAHRLNNPAWDEEKNEKFLVNAIIHPTMATIMILK